MLWSLGDYNHPDSGCQECGHNTGPAFGVISFVAMRSSRLLIHETQVSKSLAIVIVCCKETRKITHELDRAWASPAVVPSLYCASFLRVEPVRYLR